MKIHRRGNQGYRRGERGQAMLFLVLVLGVILLGMVAFAVDMGNMWFQRQQAQTAADSACTAAAMDMLYTDVGVGSSGGFTAGTSFSCSSASTASPCVYAAKNMGYAPSAITAGVSGYDVYFSFPSSVSGLKSCSSGTGAPPICNDTSALTNNFVQVNVDDRVPTYFAGLLAGRTTSDVGAQATCGVVL